MKATKNDVRHRFLLIPAAWMGLVHAPALSGQTYLYNRADFATGNLPAGIVAADFNADGIADLAIANQQDNTVSVLLGLPGGGFAKHVDYPTSASAVAVAAGDFNGDGKLDLAVVGLNCTTTSCTTPGSVSILIGNGDGTFQSHVDYQVGQAAIGFIKRDRGCRF